MEKNSECGAWAAGDPLVVAYHDNEWCRVSHDDRYLFELLCLEGASVGLSWRTIINKRAAYREAFFDFDIDVCASLSTAYLESLLQNPGLIRNRHKIFSVQKNAVAAQKIIAECDSLDAFIWAYTDGQPIDGRRRTVGEIPTVTELSRRISRDLKQRGLSFVGSTITYSYMQAIGLVNDHLLDCPFH